MTRISFQCSWITLFFIFPWCMKLFISYRKFPKTWPKSLNIFVMFSMNTYESRKFEALWNLLSISHVKPNFGDEYLGSLIKLKIVLALNINIWISVFHWAMSQFRNKLTVWKREGKLYKTLWCVFFGTPCMFIW